MTDDRDLRDLLPLLDDQVEAPSELVDRVWADASSLLRNEASPIAVAGRTGRTPEPTQPVRVRWLAAAVSIAVVIGLGALIVVAGRSDQPAIIDQPLDSVPAITTAPSPSTPTSRPDDASIEPSRVDTVGGACERFREGVGDSNPLDLSVELSAADVPVVENWVERLSVLLDDLGTLDQPPESSEIVALQLIRTALRSVTDDLATDDLAAARTAQLNAAQQLQRTPSGCLLGDAAPPGGAETSRSDP